ncbi:MAG: pseudouridine synthase [Bacteroidales bacterium]|jgi:23S rRNA pseudouridine2605 synthase|nr:pseudouridine synthase [Bacteroidales bacterium]MCI1733276.1 pseudouridine synthase [Bacteroidales bacterium]
MEKEFRPRRSDSKSTGRSYGHRKFSAGEGSGRPQRRSFHHDRDDKGEGSDEKPRRSFRGTRDGGDRPRRSFGGSRDGGDRPRRSYGSSRDGGDRPRRSFGDKPRSFGDRPFRRKFDDDKEGGEHRERKSYGDKPRTFGDRPRRSFGGSRDGGDRPRRSFGDKPRSFGDRPFRRKFDDDKEGGEHRERRSYGDKPRTFGDRPRRSFGGSRDGGDRPRRSFGGSRDGGDRPRRSFGDRDRKPRRDFDAERAARREEMNESRIDRFQENGDETLDKQRSYVQEYTPKPRQPKAAGEEGTRLNKFIANSGICSRREADDFITAGVVSINDQVITELGTKVFQNDVVKFNGEVIKGEQKVYILMNKPKDYVTTTSDPHAEKTVMDLVEGKCAERVYPVGRLDRETTGVLLLTNDGELTEQLTHPSYEKKKIYQVFLDKNLKKDDFEKIVNGIELEDGPINADALSYIDEDESQLGIEIHTGRNRIVRRIFESLGYKVKKLDRVYFAGLTKKGLRRGQWRFLTQQEIGMLKMGSYK